MTREEPGRSERFRFFKRSVRDEVDSELDFHVEMRTRELIARGISPDDARAAAMGRFGDLAAVNAECRTIANQREGDVRRTEALEAIASDARFAVRQLARARGFALVAISTLALGVGATTAIFSAVEAVSLRPFPFKEANRMVFALTKWPFGQGSASAGDFESWRHDASSLQDVSAFGFRGMTVSAGHSPDRLLGATATASVPALYGASPSIGRWFSASEEPPGHPVVVLSDGYWRREFAADTAALGQTLTLDGVPHTVIGVMPAEFDPTDSHEQLWTPLALTPAQLADHDDHNLTVVGRLRPGVTLAAAQREMDAISKRLASTFPQTNKISSGLLQDFTAIIVGGYRTQLYVLLGAVGCVLLIACGNVANLLLARGSARAREIAVRAAIGAGRGRIMRQLLTESLVLSAIATVVGLGLAWIGIKVLVGASPGGIPRLAQAHIDGGVLLFALLVSVVSSAVFGVVPALRVAKSDFQTTLREGGRLAVASARDRVRLALIVAEVAVAVTLLAGTGLLVRSAMYLNRVDPGFAPGGLLAASIAVRPVSDSAGALARTIEFGQVLDGVRARPGVAAAALSSSVPFLPGNRSSNGIVPEGRSPTDPANRTDARMHVVSPGYFATMRIGLRYGRDFTAADRHGVDRVMIVSEALARRMWPNENPIGKRVMCCEGSPTDPAWKTVIGVAGDVRSNGPAVDVYPEFYIPVSQIPVAAWGWINATMSVVVRATSQDASALAPALRQAVVAVDPTLPVFQVSTFNDGLRKTLAESRFHLLLLATLGAIGLLLAAAGIYSIVSYFVELRTSEIGVRMALGASPADVVRLLTWQGLAPVLAGAACGLVIAVWAGRLLRGSLYGVQPNDPLTMAAVAIALLAVALAAILVPTRRALSLDPSIALHG